MFFYGSRPTEIARTSQHYSVEGFEGARNWSPIMPRDASLSDSYNNNSSYASSQN